MRWLLLHCVVLFGCNFDRVRGIEQAEKPTSAEDPEAPLTASMTTVQSTVVPAMTRRNPADPRSPVIPANRYVFEDNGYSGMRSAEGMPYVPRGPGGEPPPAPVDRKRLTRFAHLSDLQLADDESPARMVALDGLGDTNGAFRPHEGYGCRILRAAVHTIRTLHAMEPLEFVMLGGDNMDNAQENELTWVLGLLGDGEQSVWCDSGDDDHTSVKEPITSVALPLPYKWITGNHDILVQGNLRIDDYFSGLAVGTNPALGTRDYRQIDAPMTLTSVPADPRRRLLDRSEILRRVAADGDGHGVTAQIAATGKANYAFDTPGSNIRVIVIDTASDSGGAEGLLRRHDVENTIIPLFDQARADKKLIVLSQHHGVKQLTTDGGLLGFAQADAVSPDEWVAILDRYPEIVFSIVGHSHEHRVRELTLPSGRHLWEVMTASLMDYPGQFRVIDIFDEGNGWLMLRATCVDYLSDADPSVEEGRQLMFLDWVSGWGLDGSHRPGESNVELYTKKPN